MITFGGMIADEENAQRVNRSGIYDLDFVSRGDTQVAIAVPPLTVREKQWLDSKISELERERMIEFELDPEMLRNFKKYYKHYPTYYETLV